jgi:hypothetical protein
MINTRAFFLLFVVALAVLGCAHRHVVTTWKPVNTKNVKLNKILVTGIVQDTNLALRQLMEQQFVTDLKSRGYNAVSSTEEFGPHGLANLQREQTYQKLCGQGIDAVLTIALLDKKKEQKYSPARVYYYSSLYYYNRIWDYKKIQADLQNQPDSNAKDTQYMWECILFDLSTLQPLYSAQTRSFDPALTTSQAQGYANRIVSELLKSKLIAKPEPVKAF